MRFVPVVVLALLALGAAPARAQQPDSVATGLVRGAYSLSFAVPQFGSGGGTGTFGFWRMVSGRTNLGLNVSLHTAHGRREIDHDTLPDRESVESVFSVFAGPALRRYLAPAERLGPFLYGSVQAGYTHQRQRADGNYHVRTNGVSLGGEAGVGLEWFPTRDVSFSGHTGVRAGVSSFTGEFDQIDEGEFDDRNFSAGTFTAGLSINLYFRPRGR